MASKKRDPGKGITVIREYLGIPAEILWSDMIKATSGINVKFINLSKNKCKEVEE